MQITNLKQAREILTKEFNLKEGGTWRFTQLAHIIGYLNTLIRNIEENRNEHCNNCGIEIKGKHTCVEI